jgi:hypothetical protein
VLNSPNEFVRSSSAILINAFSSKSAYFYARDRSIATRREQCGLPGDDSWPARNTTVNGKGRQAPAGIAIAGRGSLWADNRGDQVGEPLEGGGRRDQHCGGHWSITRIRCLIVSLIRGRCLIAVSKTERARPRLLPA